jgi:hypothetical protein
MEEKALAVRESSGDSLVRLAIEKGIDVDNLQRLIDMRNAEIERQAKLDFQFHFAEMQKAFIPVTRAKQGYNYKYAPIELLQNTLGPIIADHGFSYSWREESIADGGKRCILSISGYGYTQENYFDIPKLEKTKEMNSVQVVGAMSTYGRRYSFIAGFGVVIDDEDPDGRAIPEDQEEMQSVKNAKGGYSKPVDPGEPAKRGDGIAGDMQVLKVRLMNCNASAVFTPDERKDMVADYHPGGRNVTNSQNDLDYLKGIVEKWETIRENREEKRIADTMKELSKMDEAAEEGFAKAMSKGD